MNAELGAIGRLLDGVGQITGQAFSLIPRGETPSSSEQELRPIEAEAIESGRASCVVTDSDALLCGVPVSTSEGAQLLVVRPGASGSPSTAHQDALLDILGSAKQLIDEREASQRESTELAEELNHAYEDLYLFSRIASQIRTLHFSETMLRDLLKETREAMRVQVVAAIFPGGDVSNVRISDPEIETVAPHVDAFLEKLVSVMPETAPAFESDGFIVNNSAETPAVGALHAEPFRALMVAIRNAERQYGWLVLLSFDMREIFRRGEYRLLSTMAEQCALVMANTDLYRDLETFVINLVKSFVMAIEAKDVYTKGHSERVSGYCMRMAEVLGLETKERSALQWASILHDLGKIGTPEGVLNKPGRLNDDEYDRIKGHPSKGAEILNPIDQLADALPAIRHHHERFDGTGYPDGLKGEAIPLLARIIAVADTYDAITTNRAYSTGRPHEEAMRILRENAGSQLDSSLVDAFEQAIERERT